MAKFDKAPSDPRGGHVRLYWDLLDSNAWRCSAATDPRVYIAVARYLGKSNNGDLSLPISQVKPHGVKSESTLAKSLRALAAVLVTRVEQKSGAT